MASYNNYKADLITTVSIYLAFYYLITKIAQKMCKEQYCMTKSNRWNSFVGQEQRHLIQSVIGSKSMSGLHEVALSWVQKSGLVSDFFYQYRPVRDTELYASYAFFCAGLKKPSIPLYFHRWNVHPGPIMSILFWPSFLSLCIAH